MPQRPNDLPLKKVTLNLNEMDVIKAKRLIGEGWSETLSVELQQQIQLLERANNGR
jgi:hypothetical protein